ncbi:MAG: pyruvate kinase [Bacillota bacterium]
MRRTKIVATLGPASAGVGPISALITAGADVFRLNLSHGGLETHLSSLAAIRQASGSLQVRVATLIDLRGPEVRLGPFADGGVTATPGEDWRIVEGQGPSAHGLLVVGARGILAKLASGQEVLVDDGNVRLVVRAAGSGEARCMVVDGGHIADRKKLNFPGVDLGLPAVTELEEEHIAFGVREGVDYIALSFVSGPEDVIQARRVLEKLGGDCGLIAKVENARGVERAEQILKAADGLMVARGDLGVEIPPEEVPHVQKRLIRLCRQAGKPVITATQMLESMVVHARPTRAEASDVANAILDGTDALMLSAETAVGKYAAEAVATMARIAVRAERALDAEPNALALATNTATGAIGRATATIARDLGAAAIVTATSSGHTARMVARHRPGVPVIAATPSEATARKLKLVWGVIPLTVPPHPDTDALCEASVDAAHRAGLLRDGDLVVITAGVPAGIPGTTNALRVHVVGDFVLRGTGIGNRGATGPARLVRSAAQAASIEDGDIVIAEGTDAGFLPALKRAAGLVAEEGGLTSHAAIVALNLGLPAVIGAEGALGLLAGGELVTIDGTRGLVYRGESKVL